MSSADYDTDAPPSPDFKIVLVGAREVGKTTFLNRSRRFFGDEDVPIPANHEPTYGVDVQTVELTTNLGHASIGIWDIAGVVDDLSETYLVGSDAAVLILDHRNPDLAFFDLVRRTGSIPIVILRNKIDVRGDLGPEEPFIPPPEMTECDFFNTNLKSGSIANVWLHLLSKLLPAATHLTFSPSSTLPIPTTNSASSASTPFQFDFSRTDMSFDPIPLPSSLTESASMTTASTADEDSSLGFDFSFSGSFGTAEEEEEEEGEGEAFSDDDDDDESLARMEAMMGLVPDDDEDEDEDEDEMVLTDVGELLGKIPVMEAVIKLNHEKILGLEQSVERLEKQVREILELLQKRE